MYHKEIPERIEFVDPHKLLENYKGYPAFRVVINKEDRYYYYESEHYKLTCGCQEKRLKFGYDPNNNSLHGYCMHCNFKYSKGLKQIKNEYKRVTTKHQYFHEYQRSADRYFCELCLVDKVLDVHHIVQHKDEGGDDAENLQLLCKDCHILIHSIRKIKERK